MASLQEFYRIIISSKVLRLDNMLIILRFQSCLGPVWQAKILCLKIPTPGFSDDICHFKILKISSWILFYIFNLCLHFTFSARFCLSSNSLWMTGVGEWNWEELASGRAEWWHFLFFFPGDRWRLVSLRAMPFFKCTGEKGLWQQLAVRGRFSPGLLGCHLWSRLHICKLL